MTCVTPVVMSPNTVILTLSVMKYCLQLIGHSHRLWLVRRIPRAGWLYFLYGLLLHTWLNIIKMSVIREFMGGKFLSSARPDSNSAKLLSDGDPVAVIAVTHSTIPLSSPTPPYFPQNVAPLRRQARYVTVNNISTKQDQDYSFARTRPFSLLAQSVY
jgi:hypothetical protein